MSDAKPAAARETDRKATILRAAVEVFATKGYHGCRIADVAKEAGVAYGLVYHYFKNKESLLQAVFDLAYDTFIHRLKDVVGSPQSLDEKVKAIVGFTFDAYQADPRVLRVLILQIARGSPAIGRATRDSAFAEIVQLMVQLLTQAQERGELRPEMNPVLAAAMLFGQVEMGLTAFVSGLMDAQDEEALAQAKRQVAETFLRGAFAGGHAGEHGPGAGHAGREREIPWKSNRSSSRLKTARRS